MGGVETTQTRCPKRALRYSRREGAHVLMRCHLAEGHRGWCLHFPDADEGSYRRRLQWGPEMGRTRHG